MNKKKMLYTSSITEDDLKYSRENMIEDGIENLSEESVYENAVFHNAFDFEDFKDAIESMILTDILCIASLGLWNGRVYGYKVIRHSILDIIQGDYVDIYLEDGDIHMDDTHHDGSNHYVFREIKDNVDIDKLLNDIYSGKELSNQKLSYYKKSIYPAFAELYGI